VDLYNYQGRGEEAAEKVLEKYGSIREVIGTLCFSPTHNPFRFEKEVNGGLTVELDILCGRAGFQSPNIGYGLQEYA
jgi:hypothetical protein